jgi:hypothetical protein
MNGWRHYEARTWQILDISCLELFFDTSRQRVFLRLLSAGCTDLTFGVLLLLLLVELLKSLTFGLKSYQVLQIFARHRQHCISSTKRVRLILYGESVAVEKVARCTQVHCVGEIRNL